MNSQSVTVPFTQYEYSRLQEDANCNRMTLDQYIRHSLGLSPHITPIIVSQGNTEDVWSNYDVD